MGNKAKDGVCLNRKLVSTGYFYHKHYFSLVTHDDLITFSPVRPTLEYGKKFMPDPNKPENPYDVEWHGTSVHSRSTLVCLMDMRLIDFTDVRVADVFAFEPHAPIPNDESSSVKSKSVKKRSMVLLSKFTSAFSSKSKQTSSS